MKARQLAAVGLAAGALMLMAPGVPAVAAGQTHPAPSVTADGVAATGNASCGAGTVDSIETGTGSIEAAMDSTQAAMDSTQAGAEAGARCSRVSLGSTLLGAGNQVANGNLPGAVGGLVGGAASTVISSATTSLALAAIGTAVVGAAQGVLRDAAAALGATTSPQLHTTWFSSTYWRMAAIAAVLTLPFLFAAAIQALLRSDVGLLARAAFGYLPLAMLAIGIAAPLTTLILSACDQLCSFISSAAGNESAHFLAQAALRAAELGAFQASPFLIFVVGGFMIATAFALWIELLMREAAVYVIVLMLPLAFAACVWPARRIWAVRAVELLVALILSKFAIVAVLSLGGAAISTGGNVSGLMAGAVLIMLATFSPWALMRMIPLAELAAGTAGSLRGELRAAGNEVTKPVARAAQADEWVERLTARMRPDADADPPARPEPAAQQERPPAEARTPPAADDASLAPESADGDERSDTPSRSVAETWSSQPVLELDAENLGSTPVWPNEDAK